MVLLQIKALNHLYINMAEMTSKNIQTYRIMVQTGKLKKVI